MNEYYSDIMLLGMKPFTNLHRLGVNGKQSGSLAAIHEIPNAVTVMYGPRGCGFHYRNTVRVRSGPVPNLECADLADQDIIFGGERKLQKVLRHVDTRNHPEIIFILPTVVSDVINDDILGIVQEIQPEISAKIVVVKSQAFSHMDKTVSLRNMAERAKQNCKQKFSGADYRGCGYVELMSALVEQVMEPQEKEPLSINIESFLWGYGGTEKLQRMEKLLARMGIRINAFFPTAPLEKIRNASAAALNLVRRKKWAMTMEEKFGTPYLHVADMSQWHGLDGMRELYETIGERLGILDQVRSVVAEEEERIRPVLAALREKFAGHSFCLIVNGISAIPDTIKCYEKDFGIPLKYILLIPNPNFQRDFSIDSALMDRLYQRIWEAMALYGCKAKLTVNPSPEEMQRVMDNSEFLICGRNPRYARFGKPIIPTYLDRDVFDYESFVEVIENLADMVRPTKPPKHLLLDRVEYDPVFYPLQRDDRNTMASKEMYTRMWRLRNR